MHGRAYQLNIDAVTTGGEPWKLLEGWYSSTLSIQISLEYIMGFFVVGSQVTSLESGWVDSVIDKQLEAHTLFRNGLVPSLLFFLVMFWFASLYIVEAKNLV